MQFCCKDMSNHVYQIHEKRWVGDLADKIVYYSSKYEEYGIPIKTDGCPAASSYVLIAHCPWCGAKLPPSRREEAIARDLFEECRTEEQTDYPLLHHASAIVSAEIALLTDDESTPHEPPMKTLSGINDVSRFLTRFQQVPCYLTASADYGVIKDEPLLKLTYENGDYELIASFGQAWLTSAEGFINDKGSHCFDPVAFHQLITQYNT